MRMVIPIGKRVEENGDHSPAPIYRVLIVEDNTHTADLLEFMLNRAGYQVLKAMNGRAAQQILENVPPVDVILLDLMLPYVSGYEIIKEARDSPGWRYVPIIVVSAKTLEQDVVTALDLGANDYLTKPFRPEELLARVRRIIATQEQQGQDR